MWDQNTRLPVPPFNFLLDPQIAWWTTVVMCVLNGLTLTYGLYHLRTARGRMVLLLMAAGFVVSLCEPILDILGGAVYPHIGLPVAFELMGRPIPVWNVAAYGFFFGMLGVLMIEALLRGLTSRQLWFVFLIPVLTDIVMQEVMLHFNLLLYYGNQPLILINKFPLWWPPCDSFGNFLSLSVFFLLMPVLRGPKAILLVLLYPLTNFAGYALTGLVGFTVVNSQLPTWATQLGGLASWVVGPVLVWAMSHLLCVDRPFGAMRVAAAQAMLLPRPRSPFYTPLHS